MSPGNKTGGFNAGSQVASVIVGKLENVLENLFQYLCVC